LESQLPSPRLLTTIVALVAVVTLLVPSAHAGPLVTSAPDCDDQVPENPFRPWGDPLNYVLVPNGILEGGTRHWTLDGDASGQHGNEPFFVHSTRDRFSLALPPRSSATTATMCVGIEDPTLRFFARNEGSIWSTLVVEVFFEDAEGRVRSQAIGQLRGGPVWEPTPPLPLLVNLLPLLPGERTPVAFRFTTVGEGDWSLDDVYVDPWRHG
jgi:hypothetical protein